MPVLTLNFSLKPHSKVNVYLDGKLCCTAVGNDRKKLDVSTEKHNLRLVQFRGKNERSPLAFGALPYLGGGASLNGDGTKSTHLIPWRATVYYCECTLDFDIQTDGAIAVLSAVDKQRGFIGVDNSFIRLKIGTAENVDIENVSVADFGGREEKRFKLWQRIILLLTYIPLLAIIIWQTVVAFTHWSTPAIFSIHGKYSIILPVILTIIMCARIIHFSRKL